MATSASNSVTNSPISSAAHSPPPPQHQEVSSPTVPEESKEKVVKDPLDDMESRQIEKFKRYEVESSRYLMSKYFSDKTIFGELACLDDLSLKETSLT
ncbi:uncharacterized protein [Nicotiana tomentosiformis]|uniref:uncharacterized protein isoform X2 n=1 Tax=Nicotiana tomentosiformis TaxID=4098 RepID=UPI00051C1D60|nr:uncharacterized protein LOC104102029 isoform X2 [Nicotiana tomentosiformis]